jgi:hypothetical protein
MDPQHVLGHAAWTWTWKCAMNMDVQHGHGYDLQHELSMLHVSVQAACPCCMQQQMKDHSPSEKKSSWGEIWGIA